MQQHKRAIPIRNLLTHISETSKLLAMIDRTLQGHPQNNPRVVQMRAAVEKALKDSDAILTRAAP